MADAMNVTEAIESAIATAGESYMPSVDANNAWLLQSGYLVFFMQAGFAMLCAGSVRAKNAKNIILLNVLDACLGSLCWFATGWAFAYGGDVGETGAGNAFIGHSQFFMTGLPQENYALWFFQFTFAATAATIVSGAVAERCKFQAYLLYEMILVLFVYPCVAHWVWSTSGWMSSFKSDGYLFGTGVLDFAGDGPVHMVGGFASLAAAKVLGPRLGRFDANGVAQDMPGHNASLTLLGVFFLWFGWFGFNPGSTLCIAGCSGLAALVAVNTTLAAACGALSCMAIDLAYNYRATRTVVYDLIMVGNGALAGLVSITGGAGFVRSWAALPIGLIGGAVYFGSSKLLLNKLKIDDPLDAIPVHAFCGMWGVIATAAFAAPELAVVDGAYGFIMGAGAMGGKLLAAHLVYIIVIAAWSLGIMTPFFLLLKKVDLFRVSPEVEAAGLDVSHHGGSAYPHEMAGKGMEGGGVALTPDMVDRKIAEALAKAQLGGK